MQVPTEGAALHAGHRVRLVQGVVCFVVWSRSRPHTFVHGLIVLVPGTPCLKATQMVLRHLIVGRQRSLSDLPCGCLSLGDAA
jgi:uncharacterized membrane protein (GlpM family)